MRRQGGDPARVARPQYIATDGRRHFIWGGRPRNQGMPAFPSGRAAPAFPKVGGGTGGKDAAPRPRHLAAELVRRLDRANARRQRSATAPSSPATSSTGWSRQSVLTSSVTETGGTVYAIPPTAVSVVPLSDDDLATTSDPARLRRLPHPDSRNAGGRRPARRLPLRRRALRRHRPCRRVATTTSTGACTRRRTCGASCPASTRACSRTSCGSSTSRAFKAGSDDPGAPNVLVATPTLEMGIDIGDLSSVVLASLPQHRRVLPPAGRPRGPTHRQRAEPRLRHRPRRVPAPARRPAVGHQRRGPAPGHLPRRRGDPAAAVHRLDHRPPGPRPVPADAAEGRRGAGVRRSRLLPPRRSSPMPRSTRANGSRRSSPRSTPSVSRHATRSSPGPRRARRPRARSTRARADWPPRYTSLATLEQP